MKPGFFNPTLPGIETPPAPVKVKGLRRLPENSCEVCGLHKTVQSPKMEVTGEGRLGILYLGECQGLTEDQEGRQFVGDAGAVIRGNLRKLGLDFNRDFYALNAVRCCTWETSPKTGNRISRNPTDQEISLCHAGTWGLIRQLQPKAIWLAGGVPLQSYLLDKRQEKPAVSRWRGWCIPDQDLKCWVVPMYHPSYPLRNPKDRGLARLFLHDLQDALEKCQRPFTVYDSMKHISILSEAQAIKLLGRVVKEKPGLVELDFETTGLKPHKEGHGIIYVAICFNNHSYAFKVVESLINIPILVGLRRIIAHPDIPIAAHNIQFEDLWSRVALKVEPRNWAWDSEIAAHVLDDRAKITSLEFQAAVRYGDFTFKNDTQPYLVPPTKIDGHKTGANDFNRIHQCPPDKILLRVAKDALYGYWLAFDQMPEIGELGKPMKRGYTGGDAYTLFHDGTLALGQTMVTGGIRVDVPYLERQKQELADAAKQLENEILASDPALRWQEKTGKTLNPSSGDQLRKLLFTYYGVQPLATTEKSEEKGKVDYELLSSLSGELSRFGESVLEFNKIKKLSSTFIEGYLREEVDGYVYPFVRLNTARSYRSNSTAPNAQNIPKRDEYSHRIIRMGLFPHSGHRWLGADYGSHEFVIAACYSRDPVMIKYIQEGGDPHGDQARRIFLLTKKQTTKNLRYIAKGDWVFAQQYGSWYAACAKNMWGKTAKETLPDGTPVHTHLEQKGIRSLAEFTEHCKVEEDIYWKKFAGLRAWQMEWLGRYERDGIVPMYHGFRRQGLLSRNQIFNSSIQGTGYHFLQESFNELMRIATEEAWQSRIITEVHDEIRCSVHPEEFEYVVEMHRWVMGTLMQERHGEFLCVPLKIEFKAGEVDAAWATETELAL